MRNELLVPLVSWDESTEYGRLLFWPMLLNDGSIKWYWTARDYGHVNHGFAE